MNENEIEKKEESKLPEVTDQNLKFMRLIQSGVAINDAYKASGYTGKSADAPYALYHSLKKRIQALQDADSLDGVKLRSKLSEILNLPIKDTQISIKDRLNAIKLTNDIVNGQSKSDNPSITAFVIKMGDSKTTEVIDVKEVEKE